MYRLTMPPIPRIPLSAAQNRYAERAECPAQPNENGDYGDNGRIGRRLGEGTFDVTETEATERGCSRCKKDVAAIKCADSSSSFIGNYLMMSLDKANFQRSVKC